MLVIHEVVKHNSVSRTDRTAGVFLYNGERIKGERQNYRAAHRRGKERHLAPPNQPEEGYQAELSILKTQMATVRSTLVSYSYCFCFCIYMYLCIEQNNLYCIVLQQSNKNVNCYQSSH